jgi:hypothetical protein
LKDDGDGRVAIRKAGKGSGETPESEHCGVAILEAQRDRE